MDFSVLSFITLIILIILFIVGGIIIYIYIQEIKKYIDQSISDIQKKGVGENDNIIFSLKNEMDKMRNYLKKIEYENNSMINDLNKLNKYIDNLEIENNNLYNNNMYLENQLNNQLNNFEQIYNY